jgi:hypothetical protein
MLRQIKDIDNIVLAPCENSLTSIIQKYGKDFYNSPEFIEKKQIASLEFEKKRNELTYFMIKHNILITPDFNMINTWDNSKTSKTKLFIFYNQQEESNNINNTNNNDNDNDNDNL